MPTAKVHFPALNPRGRHLRFCFQRIPGANKQSRIFPVLQRADSVNNAQNLCWINRDSSHRIIVRKPIGRSSRSLIREVASIPGFRTSGARNTELHSSLSKSLRQREGRIVVVVISARILVDRVNDHRHVVLFQQLRTRFAIVATKDDDSNILFDSKSHC